MGYTHYYYQKKSFTPKQWVSLSKDARTIIAACDTLGIALRREFDDPRLPLVDASQIRFNGEREQGHETFFLDKDKPANSSWRADEPEYFAFCKTARKPYDLAVCLVLLAAIGRAPKTIRIESDGEWDPDWAAARKVYRTIFCQDARCPFPQE